MEYLVEVNIFRVYLQPCSVTVNSFAFITRDNLGTPEVAWVRVTEAKVFTLLRETPPDGDQFVTIITKILKVKTLITIENNLTC